MAKITPFVSIVIVNYNGRNYLEGCFKKLFGLDYPKNRLEIIMVDNGSADNSLRFVKKNFPKVRVLKNNINNYARANNLGASKAKGEYVAFINNDLEVEKRWLPELVKVMEKEKHVGVAGGKILLKDGKIHSAGHEEYPNFYWGDRGYRQDDKGQYNKIEEVVSLCGAAVLYRKSCLDQIGPIDEDFVMYLEDVDMCFRASKNKWKILYVPKSTAMHHFRGTGNSESIRYLSERNRLLLIAKHFPRQLGKALYGKGYFNGQERNIYDILGLIFIKLLNSQHIKNIKSLLPSIFKNLKNMSNLEKSILMDRVDEFKGFVSKKEALAAELSRANTELREHAQKLSKDLESKESVLKEKEALSVELNRSNAELNKKLQNISIDLSSKEAVLREKEALAAELSRANTELREHAQKLSKDLESKESVLKEKEALSVELNRSNAELNKKLQNISIDLSSKEAVLREKEALTAELSRANTELREHTRKLSEDVESKASILQERDIFKDELNRVNIQLRAQLQKFSKDIEFRDSLLEKKESLFDEINSRNSELNEKLQNTSKDLSSKEAVSLELRAINARLYEQIQKVSGDIALRDAIMREKEALTAELSRANTELREHTQKLSEDLESKEYLSLELVKVNNDLMARIDKITEEVKSRDLVLKAKDSILTELNRMNTDFSSKIKSLSEDTEAKSLQLVQKEHLLNKKESELQNTIEELMMTKYDMEKIIRFDQKINILLVKPQRISVEDTEETVRLIKKKYPNSSVYLLANLLKKDYERLSINNNIEKSLISHPEDSLDFFKMPRLFKNFATTKFDMSVTLMSHKNEKDYTGYKKARVITILGNPKNQYSYYVD